VAPSPWGTSAKNIASNTPMPPGSPLIVPMYCAATNIGMNVKNVSSLFAGKRKYKTAAAATQSITLVIH